MISSAIVPLRSYAQTLAVIADFARRYKNDLAGFAHLSAKQFYDVVHALPYVDDPEELERVSRPGFTIQGGWPSSRDCDDKCALFGGWCELTKTPWRMVVVSDSEHKNPHHVYPEIKLGSIWTPADATYPALCGFGVRLYSPENYRRVVYPQHV